MPGLPTFSVTSNSPSSPRTTGSVRQSLQGAVCLTQPAARWYLEEVEVDTFLASQPDTAFQHSQPEIFSDLSSKATCGLEISIASPFSGRAVGLHFLGCVGESRSMPGCCRLSCGLCLRVGGDVGRAGLGGFTTHNSDMRGNHCHQQFEVMI